MPTPAETEAVIAALQDPNHTWRTIRGVAKSTGLPAETVRAVLYADNRVIKSELPSAEDEGLYTTYDHYKQKTSLLRRVWNAIRS